MKRIGWFDSPSACKMSDEIAVVMGDRGSSASAKLDRIDLLVEGALSKLDVASPTMADSEKENAALAIVEQADNARSHLRPAEGRGNNLAMRDYLASIGEWDR